jgi:predicted Zn-dependent protease
LIEDSRAGANKAHIDEAIRQLKTAQRDEARSPRIHRLLATAYGYQGNDVEARLHLAEEAVLQRRFDSARGLAKTLSGQLPEGSRSWLRAQDILVYIDTVQKKTDSGADAPE